MWDLRTMEALNREAEARAIENRVREELIARRQKQGRGEEKPQDD